jgi:diphosphomevalonate decarboxylase
VPIQAATAVAHPNIALAKYWGKLDEGHNLPAVPSLSVTLAGMTTTTTVTFDPSLVEDELELGGTSIRDGAPSGDPSAALLPAGAGALRRVSGLLDRVREASGISHRARVSSRNDFPTASGLASSASAFAALAVAATAALGLQWSPARLSDLARRSSVSSARSIFEGFVELPSGRPSADAGALLAAAPVAPPDHLPLRILVAVTREGPKATGSTQGMLHTTRTSPYFPAWVADAPALFAKLKDALLQRDFEALGDLAEASALRMHAAAIAADPGLIYWTAATVLVIEEVRALRARGTPAFFTIDAGPHVKVLTTPEHEASVTQLLEQIPGVRRTIATRPGGGARALLASEEASPEGASTPPQSP